MKVEAGADLDFETENVYDLEVMVTDNAGLTGSGIVTVNLKDINEAPTLPALALTAEENSPVGHVVALLQAQDEDVAQRLTYEIVVQSVPSAFELQRVNDREYNLVVLRDILDYEDASRSHCTVTVFLAQMPLVIAGIL